MTITEIDQLAAIVERLEVGLERAEAVPADAHPTDRSMEFARLMERVSLAVSDLKCALERIEAGIPLEGSDHAG